MVIGGDKGMLTSEIIILSKRGMKWTKLVLDTPPSLIEFPIGVEEDDNQFVGDVNGSIVTMQVSFRFLFLECKELTIMSRTQ